MLQIYFGDPKFSIQLSGFKRTVHQGVPNLKRGVGGTVGFLNKKIWYLASKLELILKY